MHPKQAELERRFKCLFDEIDDWMESRYEGRWPLHPNRLPKGQTANKENDGLFNIGMNFTPGYGSRFGRGYLIEVELSTLQRVDPETRRRLCAEVAEEVERRLPLHFPERMLSVRLDGTSFKIVGDFSLGEV